MKKFLSVILMLLLLTVSVCGCNKEKAGENSSKDTSSVTADAGSSIEIDGITIAAYKNISIDWESEYNSSLLNNSLQDAEGTVKKVTDRAIKSGDTANIDYTGYKNGIKFEGGEATGYDLTIGSNSFIDGFEEGLIGVKPGETKNLNLTFPENYGSADLAGADVVFKVKVNYISEKSYSDKDILAAKESVFSQVLVHWIVENSKFGKLPNTTVNKNVEVFESYYEQAATSNGYESLDAYIAASGITEEEFDEIVMNNAEEQTKIELVINGIAKNENISVSEKEYETTVESYANTYSTTAKAFEEANGKDNIKYSILQNEVADFLVKNSVCK